MSEPNEETKGEELRDFLVTVPIAGHAYVNVRAKNEEEAIEAAMEKVTMNDIHDWEPLRQFNAGNVCYCPQPWEAEAEED